MRDVSQVWTPTGVRGALMMAALTLLVRLSLVWLQPIVPLAPDYAEYTALAQTMAEEGTYGFGRHLDNNPVLHASYWPFLYERHEAMFRPPGYPLFLVVVRWLAGPSELALACALALVEALTAFALMRLAERHYGAKAATIATLLFALSPGSAYLVLKLAREPLLSLATLLFIFGFLRAKRQDRPGLAFAVGLFAGLATYVKETALLLVIGAAAWCVLVAWQERKLRVLRLAIAVSLGAGLMIAPWIARNSLIKHKPMGFTCVGFQWYVALVPVTTWHQTGTPAELAASDPLQAKDCADVGDRLARVTQMYVRERPAEAAMTAVKNALWFWSPLPRWGSEQGLPPMQLAAGAVIAAELLLSAYGFWLRRRESLTQLLAVVLAITTVAHLGSLGAPRFRVPFEPLLLLMAALAIEAIAARWRART